MNAVPQPVHMEKSTRTPSSRFSATVLVLAAITAAADSPAAAERSGILSPKGRNSEKMAAARKFLERSAEPQLTALSRAERERIAFPGCQAHIDSLVDESLRELEEVNEEAAEMEVEPPGGEVKRTARRILTALAREFPRYYAVTPGEGREVAIQASAGMGKGRGVLVVCDEDGVACLVTMDGKNRRARYDRETAKDLPDDFIRAAMRELG